ncbi:MAG: DUF5036 family protein [Bacteroidales bacterium]|nr:DUF5036 family protein [Bacteroidales bacterium]MCL2133505.1 DUF5036 family protein [Bacteroidales bacterium]
MRNSANGGTRVTPSGTGNYFYIDGANNFYGDYHKFVTIGPMKGLGNVTQIPSSGWASEVAVQPGYGYVARCESYGAYVRIYVVKYVEAVGGGIIGADVKYQSPFVP